MGWRRSQTFWAQTQSMNTDKPERPRHKGKPLVPMKPSTVDTIVLALAMELRDDITLLRVRMDQLLKALGEKEQ